MTASTGAALVQPEREGRSLNGLLLGVVARLWVATLRVRLVVSEELARTLTTPATRPLVYAFFHGTQLSLLGFPRRRKTSVMVSLSKDGAMQARALALQGLGIVRGSTSRGGARALVALVRALRTGADVAFAVDGPRGPYGVAKAGAVLAARAANGLLVPFGSACRHAFVFRRAWDRFVLPLPFSRVVIVAGAPLEPYLEPEALSAAIAAANEKAREITFGAGGSSTNWDKLNTLDGAASNSEELTARVSGGE